MILLSSLKLIINEIKFKSHKEVLHILLKSIMINIALEQSLS